MPRRSRPSRWIRPCRGSGQAGPPDSRPGAVSLRARRPKPLPPEVIGSASWHPAPRWRAASQHRNTAALELLCPGAPAPFASRPSRMVGVAAAPAGSWSSVRRTAGRKRGSTRMAAHVSLLQPATRGMKIKCSERVQRRPLAPLWTGIRRRRPADRRLPQRANVAALPSCPTPLDSSAATPGPTVMAASGRLRASLRKHRHGTG